MHFAKLKLIEPLLAAVRSEGYTLPTDIQKQAIPHVLEGKDLLGCAQTGTGKTAAFALPILQRLHLSHTCPKAPAAAERGHARRPIRALILTPTRELAAQIGESFRVYGQHTRLRHTVIFGGVGQRPQADALHKGVDILVATPGRLLDLMNQRLVDLRRLEIFVLDEADRMLDMGFIHDIRRVIAHLPSQRQTLMFSATMPRDIRGLADTILRNPTQVTIAAESAAADTVEQALYFVEQPLKSALLEHVLKDTDVVRALVFTRTKHGANRVVERLERGGIIAEAIHSNKSQSARLRALKNFKDGATRVLVASDIAARGLDVDQISHVINYDLPNVPETYVHRIGRTGRAGAQGKAISFCSNEERDELKQIERLLGGSIPVLRHSLKPLPGDAKPASAPRQGHRHASSHSEHAPAVHKKSVSPERQKSDFWHRKRKPSFSSRRKRRP